MADKTVTISVMPQLTHDVIKLINSAKQQAAIAVNAELTLMYWQVGQRINLEVLKGERAEYGKQVIANLSKALSEQFGKGWSKRNLFQMLKFSQVFPDQQIVQAVSAQLSWSHFTQLLSIEDPLKRDFYLTMAILQLKLQVFH